MRLLILGGTGDAKRALSAILALPSASQVVMTYAIAGLVRPANVACEVVSGGFSQFGGLGRYLSDNAIDLVIDCTHPYAVQISQKAVVSCLEVGIPCWRLQRPLWQARQGDQWQSFSNWDDLMPALVAFNSVMITSGQLSELALDKWAEMPVGQTQLLRTAVAPKYELPASMTWHQAIGPFELDDELTLMKKHKVDVLVTKNSGGAATEAKLSAARQLDIPVLLIERPVLPDCDRHFDTVTELVTALGQDLANA